MRGWSDVRDLKGYMGQVLFIDLTRGTHRVEPLDMRTAASFAGGRGLGARLLWDLSPPGCDPLSDRNPLIFMTGPVTGTPVPNGSKFVVVTGSPLTGAFLDSYASGGLAAELKFAGYDALVITGRARKPSYIWIDDDRVSIVDAGDLWGLETFEAEARLRQDTSPEAGVVTIGPAGENLVRFASISSDHFRQAVEGAGGEPGAMGEGNLPRLRLGHRVGQDQREPPHELTHLFERFPRIELLEGCCQILRSRPWLEPDEADRVFSLSGNAVNCHHCLLQNSPARDECFSPLTNVFPALFRISVIPVIRSFSSAHRA